MSLLPALAALFLFAGFAVGTAERAPRPSVLVRLFLGTGLVALASARLDGAAVAAGAAAVAVVTASPLAALVAACLSAGAAVGSFSRWDVGTGVGLGVAIGLSASGVFAALQARARRAGSCSEIAALSGLLASMLLVTLDGGSVLRLELGVASGALRRELPGLGILLGVELVLGLAGALTVAAMRASPGVSQSGLSFSLGRRSLILAATLGALSVGVAAMELARLDETLLRDLVSPTLAVTLAAGLFLWAAMALLVSPPREEGPAVPLAWERWTAPLTFFACVVALLLAARASVHLDASYASAAVASMASATLVALSVVLGPSWTALRILGLFVLLFAVA